MEFKQETSISEKLANFAIRTENADIPSDVRTRALYHILDATGIALASTGYDFAQRTVNAVRGLAGQGDIPVIGMPVNLPSRDAALVNGLLCHGLDFDDTHVAGVIHPTASIFPAILSAAATKEITGQDFVTAYIVGMEAAARLGAVAKGGFHQVGFHPTGVIGTFACTLAVGRLQNLSEKQLTMAQGIALSLASGSLEFLEDGAWNKRIHPGWSASSALTAVALAKSGFVGVSRPYEGRFGLFNSYLGQQSEQKDLSLATEGLGKQWELMSTAIKPFPACHFTHACIDSALHIREELHDLSEVKSITALIPHEVVKTVCEPEENKKQPANSYDAQFSIPYTIAAALIKGRFTLEELNDDEISNPEILALANKVSYQVDPNSAFPNAYSGEVIVELESGKKLRHREHINRGVADRPLSNEEIETKFYTTSSIHFSPKVGELIASQILNLNNSNSTDGLLKAFKKSN